MHDVGVGGEPQTHASRLVTGIGFGNVRDGVAALHIKIPVKMHACACSWSERQVECRGGGFLVQARVSDMSGCSRLNLPLAKPGFTSKVSSYTTA